MHSFLPGGTLTAEDPPQRTTGAWQQDNAAEAIFLCVLSSQLS